MSDMSPEIDSISSAAPTMGRLAKVSYTHLDMIDFILANPAVSHGALAKRYGYSESWVSNIMASDAWQSQFAARRGEIVDPQLAASVEERFRALVLASQEKLMRWLDKPDCPPNVALKALELGARGIEAGGFGRPQVQPPSPPQPDRLEKLADRMVSLMKQSTGEIIDGEAVKVE